MIAVFKILTSKENASDEAFSLLVLYQLGSWMGVRTFVFLFENFD